MAFTKEQAAALEECFSFIRRMAGLILSMQPPGSAHPSDASRKEELKALQKRLDASR